MASEKGQRAVERIVAVRDIAVNDLANGKLRDMPRADIGRVVDAVIIAMERGFAVLAEREVKHG
jgi:hypothetical protein